MEDDNENTPLKGNSSLEPITGNNDALATPLDIEAAAATATANIGHGSPDPSPANENVRDACLGCLCFLSIFAVIVLFIIWLVHIISLIPPPDFQVKSLSFSSFNLTTCEITVGWNVSFYVKNPKKGAKVFYDGIRVFLLYSDEFISVTDTTSFYQGIGQQFWMNETLGLGGSPVKLNPWIVNAIDADKNIRKEIILSVVMDARVSQYPGSTNGERLWMKVFCDYLKVEFLPETSDEVGSMAAGGYGACTVQQEKRKTNS